MSIETYGGGMLSPTQVATVSGMTQEQLDTMTALVQLVDTKANQQYVVDQIAAVVGAAPGALDTLAEIAAQLGNDETAITALTNAVAGALRFDVAQSLTTPQKTQALDNLGVAAVGRTGSFNDLGDKASLLDTLLAGLSTAVSTAVLATDSIKTAIGKLQGQVTKNRLLLPPKNTSWYATDKWITPDYPYVATVTNASPALGSIYFVRRSILEPVSFKKIGAYCITANASATMIVGVFNEINGKPSTLIDKKSFSVSVTGEISATVSMSLSAGWYWDAVLVTGAAVAMRGALPIFAVDGLSSLSENPNCWYLLAGQTDLPSDVTSAALVSNQATYITRVGLQVA